MHRGVSLVSDPLYNFIEYTTPLPGETDATEQDLIDSPWMQRLRRVSQLQSARWVFPTGEHSRFTHSLGTMHNAGRFARALYPSLARVCQDLPSEEYVVELCRITGLLHDIGHGPFSHFFDEAYLSRFGINHEVIGQQIVERKLAGVIKAIRRSPKGAIKDRKVIAPEMVAYLIKKSEDPQRRKWPRWLKLLKPLFSGAFTVDNMDYVNRDSFMCGIKVGAVDVDRLRHYLFFTKEGLALHRRGGAALNMFLLARWYLYSNVYFHRTVRAIDLQLKDVFAPTVEIIMPGHPLRNLERYLEMDEWNLFTYIKAWRRDAGFKKKLARAWDKIFQRKLIWKVAFERAFSLPEIEAIGWLHLLNEQDLEKEIGRKIGTSIPFKVDLATMDPRPINPLSGNQKILIYDDQREKISSELSLDYLKNIPARLVQFRVFTSSFQQRKALGDQVVALFDEKGFPTSV